jgi:tetratricopeptide (TPR) repeat protein
MKTTNLIPCFISFLFAIGGAHANDNKYIETMQKNIQAVYEAATVAEFQAAVNAFERIAQVENTRWEPQYYTAFGYLMICSREQDAGKKDQAIDRALAALEKAKSLAPEESEIIALEGFALMMRVSVDPATRGPQFAGLAVQSYEKALKYNPENPRALVLLAQMQYGTAQFFGSSTVEACETLRNAVGKFDTYKSDNVLAPQWGRRMATGLQEKCK